ncbi:MAG: hypothetical protein GY696_31820, partial [Gammaproteobacteria bacterium]|nr:hypothetical protein [Gammaproteobacteria bacterium]
MKNQQNHPQNTQQNNNQNNPQNRQQNNAQQEHLENQPKSKPKQPPTCYRCGVKGHIAPECTWSTPPAAPEMSPIAPPVSPPAVSGNKPLGNSKVVQALSGPRIVTCHSKKAVRMVGQSPEPLIADSVYYPLEIEGVPTSALALVDCGSVISIASLELIMKIAEVGDRQELLSRCQMLTSRFDGYGGKPLSDLRVFLPLKVKCRGAAETTILCAVDEGENAEAEFLLGKGGMRDLGFQLLSPTGEDLLTWPVSALSALEFQPAVLEAVAPIAKAEAINSQRQPTNSPPKVFHVSMSTEKGVRVGSLKSAPLGMKVQSNLPKPREGYRWMFSASEELAEEGLSVEDAVVTVTNREFPLPVVNYGS